MYTEHYLKPTDAGAFQDFPAVNPNREFALSIGYTQSCPVCQGHGGWNLRLHAYSLHHHPDTPENRHRYSHFRSVCGHCNGLGSVHPSVTCQGHEWRWVKNLGRCYNRYECIHCAAVSDVDSSD